MQTETVRRKKLSADRVRQIIPQVILNICICFLLFLMLYPLAMAIWNALKIDYLFENTKWYPTLPLVVTNLIDAFGLLDSYILNTVEVGIFGGGGLIIIASISAYTFAKMRFPGRKAMYAMVIALLMMPGILTLIPQLMIYRGLGLTKSDSIFSLILPLWTSGPIFGVFLLTSFFRGIPNDIFEAAKIDGAGDFVCYFRIALPICMPIMGTLAIMTLVNIWNDYLWPMTVMEDRLTIAAALVRVYTSEHSSNTTMQFAGYLVSAIPLIVLFVVANKYYIEGLIGSSIKL